MRYVAVLVAVGVGYVMGRARPFDLLASWTEDQIRHHPDHWDAAPKQAALLGLLLLTDHNRAIQTWKAWTKERKREHDSGTAG